jgi:hypothetical protein
MVVFRDTCRRLIDCGSKRCWHCCVGTCADANAEQYEWGDALLHNDAVPQQHAASPPCPSLEAPCCIPSTSCQAYSVCFKGIQLLPEQQQSS